MERSLITQVGALLLLIVAQSLPAQTTTLRYGQIPSTVKTISALQFTVALRKGLFTREGINLETVLVEGGADNMMTALNKGAVEITRTATPYLIQSVLAGSDGVAIAAKLLRRSTVL